ncbi:MAG: cytochrome C [Anaerolineae bacterium]
MIWSDFRWPGISLQENGTPFTCRDCHGESLARFDVLTCSDCHGQDDPAYMQAHIADFGTACLDCHDGIDSFSRANFDHSQVFALTGKHMEATSSGCHAGARTVLDLQATPTTCVACHAADDAHDGQLGQECAACHVTSDWREASFDHSLSAFPLTGQHTTVECAACHADQTFRGTPTTCFACHAADDPHDGQLGQECAACHVTSDWREASFDHSLSAFPLTGRHTAVECAACHADQTFRGTPTTCVACHAQDDAHDGQLGQECAACHVTSDWRDATFDHSLSAFPLTGRHTAVECAACHADQTFRGTPTTCVACHAQDDAHDGQLGQECAACHVTSDWRNATFDHSLSAFPLTGRHTTVECAACHADQTFRGTPTTCFACHAADDRHNGQFGQECAACHVTSDWREVTFDHSLSAFPLTGQHTTVECAACHADQTFRGTPTDCVACHTDPVFHAAAFGVTCTDCHTTTAWQPARFDRAHTFPFNHGDAGVNSCRTCHTAQVQSYTCYQCHDQGEMAEEHLKEGIADFQNCASCHPTGEKDEAKDRVREDD